jgi:hypothetical protein
MIGGARAQGQRMLPAHGVHGNDTLAFITLYSHTIVLHDPFECEPRPASAGRSVRWLGPRHARQHC